MQEFTILVVDDDPSILKMLNELLTSEPDYRVVLAGDSKEAVRAFSHERRIDVVLTDIHMPDFTGMEMMSDMKKIGFEPEIMVMTANGSPENVEKARKIGARSIILKPFDNLEVIEAEMRKAIEAAAAKRSKEPQDEVTDLTPAAAPTEGLTEQLTKEATEELPDEPTEDLAARLTRELAEELAEVPTEKPTSTPTREEPNEGPTVTLKTEESTEEVTELTEDEVTPSVPALAINQPEHPTAEEISAPRLTRTLAGNRHHVPGEATEPAKDITRPLKADPAPVATAPTATAEAAETTAEETTQEIPADLESIFRVGTDLDAEGLKLQVPIVCLQTWEEQDAIDALRRLASALGRKLYTWSSTRGIVALTGEVLGQTYVDPNRSRGFSRARGFRHAASALWRKLYPWSSTRRIADGAEKILGEAYVDPLRALDFIRRQERDSLFILADFGSCLEDPQIVRTLREIVMEGHTAQAMIVLTAPRMIIPSELESYCALFEWPASKERDIKDLFDEVRKGVESSVGRPISIDAGARETILKRLKGMSDGRVRFEIARALVKRTRS